MFYLIPVLNNSTRDKVKAIYICICQLVKQEILGNLFKEIFEAYFNWHLNFAVIKIIQDITNLNEREAVQNLINKVLTLENVESIATKTISIISLSEIDFDKMRIFLKDIYLIADRNEYVFCLESMVKEIWDRFKPLDEV